MLNKLIMKKNIFFVLMGILFLQEAFSQGVGIGTTQPDPSAKLEINSTTQGTLITRMTTAQRNALVAPANGLLIYNTTTNCFNVYVLNTWKQWCPECDFGSAVASGGGTFCAGSSISLSAKNIPGASYQWTGPNGFTSSQQNPVVSSNAQPSMSGTYSLTASMNACTTSAATTDVTVVSIPSTPGSITGASTYCQNDTAAIFSISPVANATNYSWNVPSGAIIKSNSGTSIKVDFGSNSGNISVTASNACGTSAASILPVNIQNLSSSFTPLSASLNSAVTFTPAVSGATYSWNFPSGSPANSTIENPTVFWNAVGTFNIDLTVTLGGCSSSSTLPFAVSAFTNVQTYSYTGGPQTFVVPSGIQSLILEAWGAAGGNCSSSWNGTGGMGGYAKGYLSVTPGQTIYVYVGGTGEGYPNGSGYCGGRCNSGGWNGGGLGFTAGGGGGASDVRVNGQSLTDRVIVAGGGGGAPLVNNTDGSNGGDGGALIGEDGCNGQGDCSQETGGGGGTQNAGGAAGFSNSGTPAQAGTFGQGGNSGNPNNDMSYSGGGGGGFYGGGGGGGVNCGSGYGAGGGGGSSYIGGVTNGTTTMGGQSGNGQIKITY